MFSSFCFSQVAFGRVYFTRPASVFSSENRLVKNMTIILKYTKAFHRNM